MGNVTENLRLFSQRLKSLRGDKTLDIASSEIGVSRVTLGYYESGERKPDIEILLKIANYYNVTPDYLLGLTDVKGENSTLRNIYSYTGLKVSSIQRLHGMNLSAQSGYSASRLRQNAVNWLLSSKKALDYIALSLYFMPIGASFEYQPDEENIHPLSELYVQDENFDVYYNFADENFWIQAFFTQLQNELILHRKEIRDSGDMFSDSTMTAKDYENMDIEDIKREFEW